MSTARPEAGYVTLSHRYFGNIKESGFWAVGSVIIYMELDLASVMVKATPLPSPSATWFK